jgi:hypothetical protein
MKRTVRVKASDAYDTTIELVGRIDTGKHGLLMRHEVTALADDLEQRLTAMLPDLRLTNFKVKMVVE